MASLDTDVEADCAVEISDTDLQPSPGYGTYNNMGIVARSPKPTTQELNLQSVRVLPGGLKTKSADHTKPYFADLKLNSNSSNNSNAPTAFHDNKSTPTTRHANQPGGGVVNIIEAGQNISNEMIEDGAHVVFDWDNTLKLYDRHTKQLSCRVSRDFLEHLKRDRSCRLYIISAIRPSQLNLDTLLLEVDKLGLTDLFLGDDVGADQVDGEPVVARAQAVVKSEYAHRGNVIICGYDKAETFLKLSGFDSRKGEKVMFFDDEVVNIDNFSALVPTSRCFHCK